MNATGWLRLVSRWLLMLALSAGGLLPAQAKPVPMDDEALASVSGSGVGLSVHLELNSGLLTGDSIQPNVVAGFGEDGNRVYLVLHGVGGIMDLLAVTLDIRRRADGSDYLDFGLPGFVGFEKFGIRAITVQTDPNAGAGMANNYGQLLLNGIGSMTGHVYLWTR
jgi:hypothetical protein